MLRLAAGGTSYAADGACGLRLVPEQTGKLPYKVKPPATIAKAMTSDGRKLDSDNKQLLTPGCTP